MHSNSNNNCVNKSEMVRPIVWSIGGSDSGGGAGIQADSLTIQDLGGHACNIVTAITAQNSQKITDILATPSYLMLNQLNCLLDDLMPSAIKIGVLANSEQIQIVSGWLETVFADYQQKHNIDIPIIWDPVMVSTSGQSLTLANNEPSVQDYSSLAKQVTLITPNRFELNQLAAMLRSDDDITSQSDFDCVAKVLPSNILVTGGDSDSEYATDWLAAKSIAHTSAEHEHQSIGFRSSRVSTIHNHGTGCTLSSAIAVVMALGYPLLDAIVVAKAYVHQGLTYAYALGNGAGVLARKGWPIDLGYFSTILLPKYPNICTLPSLNFAVITEPLQVYTVTQSLSVLERVLKAGARTVQLRIKHDTESSDQAQLSQDHIERDIIRAIALGRKYKAQVFINDHWQLALKHSAFGVHLGQEDLLRANLSQIAEAGLALGLSSHGYFEMLLAQQRSPSYLAIGHIFATPTKQMRSLPQGLSKLSRYCQLLNGKVPLVAIGGVTMDNLAEIKATLVNDIAVVRGIELSTDPGCSWLAFQQKWEALT
jgi:hydroxymethylpyrimidine kinase/phosphomethylpyrimidine kinase/thiamine-phosphate diphosphorylase